VKKEKTGNACLALSLLSKSAEEYSIHSASLDGDEFGIAGASPTINSSYNTREYDLKSLRVSPKGFPI
jgi:hypothetical protein